MDSTTTQAAAPLRAPHIHRVTSPTDLTADVFAATIFDKIDCVKELAEA